MKDSSCVSSKLPSEGFVRLSQIVPHIIPVSKSTWYSWIASGKAPKPVNLGPKIAAYDVRDIRGLLEKLNTENSAAA